ncbi:hypothetical protein RCC89_18545 [Cytophagaceae bacterium ABcell3]|nr:hypothetical protein RCC89_18545 [Cytophagaceae bacterium ABcell3]
MGQKLPCLSSASLKWKVPIEENIFFSSPLIHDGLVFIHGEKHRAFDLSSGEELLFNDPQKQQVFRSKISNPFLCFRNTAELYIVNLHSNETYTFKNNCWYNDMRPFFLKGNIAITVENHKLIKAYDLNNSEVLWSKEFINCRAFFIHQGDEVFFYTDSYLFCLNVLSGEIKWKTKISGIDKKPIIISENLFWLYSEVGVWEIDIQKKEKKLIFERDMRDLENGVIDNGFLYNPDCGFAVDVGNRKIVYDECKTNYEKFEFQCFLKGSSVSQKYLISNFGDGEGCGNFERTVFYDKETGTPLFDGLCPVNTEMHFDKYLLFADKVYNGYLIAIGNGELSCFLIDE